MKRRRSQEAFLAIGLLLAILLQLPLLWFIAIQTRPSKLKPQRGIALKSLSGILVPLKPVVKKRKPIPKGQVVNLPEAIKSKEAPKKTKFLSRFNTRVKKQTVAKRPVPVKRPIHGKRTRRISKVQAVHSNSTRPTRLRKGSPKKSASKVKMPVTKKGSRFTPQEIVQGMKDVLLPGHSIVQKANIQKRMGSLSDNDAIRDLPKGDETLLNSKRFVYWSFFERVKRQVESQWEPQEAILEWDPQLRRAGKKDRLTILKVVLDSQGRLLSLKVLRRSGLRYLDNEAMRAFKAAQPFPNPPKGLMDQHGRIVFSFGFLVQFGGGGVRFFWRRW